MEGQKLPAGKYGLHMIPAENGDWTIIFSKNAGAWGSFFYDEKDDALRVQAKAEKADYREWLDFEFLDRQLDTCLVALEWENLRVPFRVKVVPSAFEVYMANLRRELTGFSGFQYEAYDAAANYVLQNDKEGKYTEQALEWSNQSMNANIGGRRNFITLSTQSAVLDRLGKAEESKKARQEALKDPSVTPLQIHFYARGLTGMGKHQEALEVFQENARRFPGVWPTDLGLARGYSGVGDTKKALEYAKKALADRAGRRQPQERPRLHRKAWKRARRSTEVRRSGRWPAQGLQRLVSPLSKPSWKISSRAAQRMPPRRSLGSGRRRRFRCGGRGWCTRSGPDRCRAAR